jgi:hypothetical protein
MVSCEARRAFGGSGRLNSRLGSKVKSNGPAMSVHGRAPAEAGEEVGEVGDP